VIVTILAVYLVPFFGAGLVWNVCAGTIERVGT
jgi:hypothetical protein